MNARRLRHQSPAKRSCRMEPTRFHFHIPIESEAIFRPDTCVLTLRHRCYTRLLGASSQMLTLMPR